MSLKFRSNADDYTASDAAKFGISFPFSEGMTQPEFQVECDINSIISRYVAADVPLPVSDVSAFGDFSSVADYQEAMQSIASITEYFATLPATVRKRFANDPAGLLSMLEDPSQRSVAEELGLLERKPLPAQLQPSVAVAEEGQGRAKPSPEATPGAAQHTVT